MATLASAVLRPLVNNARASDVEQHHLASSTIFFDQFGMSLQFSMNIQCRVQYIVDSEEVGHDHVMTTIN